MQLGGQTALKLAEKLERYGIKIIGVLWTWLKTAGRSLLCCATKGSIRTSAW